MSADAVGGSGGTGPDGTLGTGGSVGTGGPGGVGGAVRDIGTRPEGRGGAGTAHERGAADVPCAGNGPGGLRVLVAEDQAAVRAGLVLILEAAEGVCVVGEADNGETAVALARELRPDVVLMDVRMPRLDGISATRELAAEGLDVLVLTTFDLDEYVFGALRAGAAGFLLKTMDAPRLVEAVRLVARGDGFVAPEVTRRLISAFAAARAPERADVPAEALASLTPRENDVLGCIGRGLTNQQIAERLDMAEATAKTHVSRILTKLGLRNRVQAAIFAQEAGHG